MYLQSDKSRIFWNLTWNLRTRTFSGMWLKKIHKWTIFLAKTKINLFLGGKGGGSIIELEIIRISEAMSRKSKIKRKRKMIWFILTSIFAFSVFCLTVQRSISGLCFLFSIFHTKKSFLGWQSYTYFYMYTNLVGNRTCDSTKYIPFENFSVSTTVFSQNSASILK